MDSLTGSKLPRAEICAASFALPATHEVSSRYADAGTAVHAQLEALAHGRTDGVPAWLASLYTDLTEGATAVYAERCLAWDPTTGEGRDLGTHGRDYSGLREGEIPCTVDLLVVRGADDSVVYDYKSGFRGARVDTPQLSHQALAAAGAFGLDGVHASIVKLDTEARSWKTCHRYLDAFDLAAEAERVRGIVRHVARARALPLAQLDVRESDDGCRYCPCWSSCPAKTRAIATLAAHAGMVRPGVEIVVTPETAGMVWEGIEAMEAVLATAKEKVKELARQAPVLLPGGRELWAVETNRETIADVDAIERIVLERYGAEAAASVVTVQKSTTKGAIEAVAKKHAAPKQGAKEARSLLDAARVAGAIKSSSYLSYTPKEKVGLSMSDGLNRVMLLGNLGADPELRTTTSGDSVLKLRLATSERYQDKNKVWQERTEWHSVTVWGKRAEALHRILSKGSTLFVEGSLRTSSYEKDGAKVYKTEVNAKEVILTGGKREGGGERADGGRSDFKPRQVSADGGDRADDDFSDLPF